MRNVTKVIYGEYLNHCLGKDELVPTEQSCEDWFNIGLTLIDSLDTLLLMDLKEEYDKSREWAAENLSFKGIGKTVSMFEIVIRALGGLNSAYDLTDDDLWRDKAVELGDILVLWFNATDTGCPPASVYLGEMKDKKMIEDSKRRGTGGLSNPAEVGTLQLEFRTLSRISGDPKYRQAVDRCEDMLVKEAMSSSDGLLTDAINLRDGKQKGRRLTIAGRVDSFYELLVKTWIAYGKTDSNYRKSFERAVKSIFSLLTKNEGGHLYVGEMSRGHRNSFRRVMDHLSCFFPGNLALAALHGLGGGVHGNGRQDYMPMARGLTESCYAMTRWNEVGLAGESTRFGDARVKPIPYQDVNFIRPEIVEALYYMDAIDPQAGKKYKEWGENMWISHRKYSQVEGKMDGLMSTTNNLHGGVGELVHEGKLHSFAIAETFKYFFMLFDERNMEQSSFPLYKWVFNTEAHPVKVTSG